MLLKTINKYKKKKAKRKQNAYIEDERIKRKRTNIICYATQKPNKQRISKHYQETTQNKTQRQTNTHKGNTKQHKQQKQNERNANQTNKTKRSETKHT